MTIVKVHMYLPRKKALTEESNTMRLWKAQEFTYKWKVKAHISVARKKTLTEESNKMRVVVI
jgi:hypothetical protein